MLDKTELRKAYEEYLNSSKDNLRSKLIESVGSLEGWEESALAMVDVAILPIVNLEISSLQDQVRVLREALKFYQYKWINVNGKILPADSLKKDKGEIAKQALAATDKEGM